MRKLLHKILDEQLTSPCLHAFMRHREEIATIYPDLFLEFLQGIVLVREKKLAPEGQNIARLRSATSWVCKGSQVLGHSVVVNGRTYWGDEDLWSHLLGHSVTVASDESGTSDRDQSFTSYFLADDPSTRIGRKSKRVEVAALRVPLEGVVSHTAGRIDSPKTTLLYLILQASAEQEDYSVFGTVLVRSILEFKWRKYGRNIFMMRLSIHLVLLFFVAVAAVGLPRSVCTPGEGGATDTCTATWREMCGSGWGVATLVSLCFSLLGCVVSLALRVRQALLLTQEVIYLGSLVEYLNTISYLCWSFVGVAFLLRDPIMLPLSAWSSMMFTFRVLAFARGFRSVGPLVRMIEKIIVKIQKFLLVMFLLIAGFALFFIALGAPPVQSLLWVLNTGVFGQDPYPGGGAKFDPLSRVSLTHTVLLFELLMMLVALVLLNLLIAIMSSVYESVERVAEFEADYEKGLSILDIERLTLPVIVNWFGLDIDELFPKWLHLLMPAGMIEDRQTVEQKPVVGRAA